MSTNGVPERVERPRRWTAAVVGSLGAGVVLGAILAGSQLAGAATSATSSTTSSTTDSSLTAAGTTAAGNGGDPAAMKHGPGETPLTGSNASKAVAAAKKAVPGATVVRAETDSGGATYEVHMKQADGTYVTVQLDASFTVTGTIDGFGVGPQGGPSSGGSSDSSA
jgi:uncharacterized membrane protein YkoI